MKSIISTAWFLFQCTWFAMSTAAILKYICMCIKDNPGFLIYHRRKFWPYIAGAARPKTKISEVKSSLDVHLSSLLEVSWRHLRPAGWWRPTRRACCWAATHTKCRIYCITCWRGERTKGGACDECARVLKVATTLTVHARKIIVQPDDASDKYWPTLLKGLPRLTALVCDLAFPSICSTGEAATSVACKHASVDARVLVRKVIKTKLCSLPIIRFPAIMHPGHVGMGRYQQLL